MGKVTVDDARGHRKRGKTNYWRKNVARRNAPPSAVHSALESALLEYDRPTKADFIWEISAVTATILGDNLNYHSFSIYSCEQYYISPGRVILGRDVKFISN